MDQACIAEFQLHVGNALMYLAQVLLDGDYLNDYLTWVPACSQPHLWEIGRLLAAMIGVS